MLATIWIGKSWRVPSRKLKPKTRHLPLALGLFTRSRTFKSFSVRYDAVNTMLLNEFLKEHRKVEEQGAMIAKQQKQIEALTATVQKVSDRLNNPEPQLVANDY